MDQYKNFGVEDFVWDQSFRQWVLAPTRENNFQWNRWLSENPDSVWVIKEARQVVLSLGVKEEVISDHEIRETVNKTIARINEPLQERYTPVQLGRSFYRSAWFQIAASVAILLIAGLAIKNYRLEIGLEANHKKSEIPAQSIEVVAPMIEKVNTGKKTMLVRLQDNSEVTLKPGSSIRYQEEFTGTSREVFLFGEAFFNISKDPDRPFLVYANELVTKVLGTSFTIKAYASSKEVTVEVKTGRVSVFAKSDPQLQMKLSRRELQGIILSPNQKIIFERDAARMEKTLVEKPEIVQPKSKVPHFEFEDTPASEVFAAIGKAYGIEIIYDEELLKDCPLTAALENQPLHEKLSIICKAVESSYEVLDGQIIIHSRGCRN
jgi:transmembrane sensor